MNRKRSCLLILSRVRSISATATSCPRELTRRNFEMGVGHSASPGLLFRTSNILAIERLERGVPAMVKRVTTLSCQEERRDWLGEGREERSVIEGAVRENRRGCGVEGPAKESSSSGVGSVAEGTSLLDRKLDHMNR